MDWEKGLFGGDWEDYHDQHIQPLLDRYDGQINDALSNGTHGEIARMQAMDDVPGSGNGASGVRADFPVSGTGQDQPNRADFLGGDPGGLASLPGTGGGRFQDVGLHLSGSEVGSLGDQTNIPPLGQPGPRNATEVENFIPQNPVILGNAGSPDDTRFSAEGAGSAVTTGPTLEDAAKSAPFYMTDQNLADIRRQAERPLDLQEGVREVVPFVAEKLFPITKPFVSGAIDILNHHLDELEPQRREEAYQQALFRTLNSTMVQSATSQNAPPTTRGFFVK